jgi:hypothetical protein
MPRENEPGVYQKGNAGLAGVVVTAGGAADDVYQNGAAIDRLNYESCMVVVNLNNGTLASGQSAVPTVKLQDSADGSTGWADYGTAQILPTITNPTQSGVGTAGFDLRGAKRYVRPVAKVNLSSANTDTLNLSAAVILSGARSYPIA